MGTFTLALKEVLELTDNVGLNVYPIFSEPHREELNKKIIDHYWNREIGVETIDLFQLAMRRKMNEIMPFYNQLFKSELKEFDPFITIDLATEGEGESTQTSETTATGANTQTGNTTGESEQDFTSEGNSEAASQSAAGSRAIGSDFPQQMIAGDVDYATNGNDSTTTTSGTSTGHETAATNTKGTEAGTSSLSGTSEDLGTGKSDVLTQDKSSTRGYQGLPSDMLMAYRATFLNIDMMIINELSSLFMFVWDNGDSYTNRRWI